MNIGSTGEKTVKRKKRKGENMAKIRQHILAIITIFCAVLFIGLIPVYAETPKGQIIMSIEKSTLGQGYLMEPQYVDFYEGDNMADVTLRQLRKLRRKYNYSGGTNHGFYLSEISDRGRGAIRIPNYIKDMITKSNLKLYSDGTPEYLGEFDYTRQSGWMYCYNGGYPVVSACEITPRNGDVLQWQFTLVGLGTDLKGNQEYLKKNNKTVLNRVEVSRLLAKIKKNPELLKNSEVRSAYERCKKLAMDLNTAQSDLSGDMTTLKKALQENTVSNITFFENISQECYVKNGTAEKNIRFPNYLQAVKSDNTRINIRVTWECKSGYQAGISGDYVFTPVLPDAYIKASGAELPDYTVHVRKLGDVNCDGQTDSQDVEALVKELGNSYEYDEDGAVYDLNFDGKVDMQDYSVLIGACSESKIHGENDARLTLKFSKSSYAPGETGSGELVFYSGKADTVGIQLDYDKTKIKNVTLTGLKGFQVEKQEQNESGIFFMLGKRSGALNSSGLQGTSIAELSFICMNNGTPQIGFGKGSSGLIKDQEALGYGNGYEVTFETGVNYGTDIRLLCQLNEGHVRGAVFSKDSITENGQSLQVVNVTFRASDAEDVPENRIRIRSQIPQGSTFEIGGGIRNGSITDPLTERNGIFYAEGSAGCFMTGRSPERETCTLYGILTSSSGKQYYKIQILRKGYSQIRTAYTDSNPVILNGWSASAPDVLTGNWSLENLKLQGWDSEGNPMSGLKVKMPSGTSGNLYYKGNEENGKLYAKKAGDYWLEILDQDNKTVGKIRIIAVYPFQAAEYYIKKAREIPTEYSKYAASVSDQVFEYKDYIDKAERVQKSYPSNSAVYLDNLGRYTIQETKTRMVDKYGYGIFCDSLRTESVNDLKDAISQIRPVLEKNRIKATATPTPYPTKAPAKKTVTFSGTKSVKKVYKKTSFALGVKTSSNGKVSYISSDKRVVTVTASGKVTVKGPGKAVITVKTAQTSKFKAGEKKIPVVITPAKTGITGISSQKTKTVTVKWKKLTGVTGYQIQLSRYKNFKKASLRSVSQKSGSAVIRGLASKNRYYVRVRGYKKVGKVTLYGSWSSVKTVKTR